MPSFDIVSEADIAEVKNGVENTVREITTRYDFKDCKATIELNERVIVVLADDTLRLKSIQEILKQKLAKREVSLKCVEFKDERPAGGDMVRQEVHIKDGLTDEELRRLNKAIKAQKLKVTTQIQGNQLRVTGKKRDDLQEVMAFLRKEAADIELQFLNFRD